MGKAELTWEVQAELGEGAVCAVACGAAWFVGIRRRMLHRYTPRPTRIGSTFDRAKGW